MDDHRSLMKMNLAESLRELMPGRLFEKITIKQICDRAGVIRATFYNYFDDKYDCLNWIVWHDLSETEKSSISEGFLAALKTIEKNRPFYRSAYNVIGQNSFEDMIRSNLKALLKNYLNDMRRDDVLPQYSNDLLAEYYAETVALCIRLFVFEKDGCRTAEETEHMIFELMKYSIYDFLKTGNTDNR